MKTLAIICAPEIANVGCSFTLVLPSMNGWSYKGRSNKESKN